jgi:hypothetical protein
VSYAYLIDGPLAEAIEPHIDRVRLLVDSGAFTAWKAGKPIKLDDYCRYLDGLISSPTPPWRYFALDVIGDPGRTLSNYQTMLARGFKPIPVFTRGEEPSMIDEYYRTSDIVGLGGLVGTPGNKDFVRAAMRIIGDRKCHWLGFTNPDYVRHYRPYSCDSSSWCAGPKYGRAPVYMGNGRMDTLKSSDVRRWRVMPPDKHRAISRIGMDSSELMKARAWEGHETILKASSILGAASWIKFSMDCRDIGVRLFLAIIRSYQVDHMMRAWAAVERAL